MDTVSVPWAEPPVCVGRGDAAENVVSRVYDGRRQGEGVCSCRRDICGCTGAARLLGPLVT